MASRRPRRSRSHRHLHRPHDTPRRSEYNRAETIEETADLVTELGGNGIAAAVDHLDPEQVRRLADRIRNEHGHIDVLVNDIWGGELLKGGPADWNTPIWKHDLDDGLRILRLAIDTHLITSHHLLPLIIDRPGGLLIEVTDGTAEYNASHYRISVFYDLAKVAVNRLAFSQGHELEKHAATAVAITPGWLRSEMMLDNFGSPKPTGVRRFNERRARQRHPTLRCLNLPDMLDVESRHWPPMLTAPGGTNGRSPRVNWHTSTDSRTSTARNPTFGDISRKSATGDSRQTSTTIGDAPGEG